jgi:MFS family permease
MIGEIVAPEKRGTYIGITAALMNLGAAILGMAGGVIAAGNGGADWPKTFWLGFVLLPPIIAFAFLMPKKPDANESGPAHGSPGGAGTAPDEPQKLPPRVVAVGLLTLFASVSVASYLFYFSMYIINEYKLGTSVHAGIASSIFTGTAIVVGFSYGLLAKLFKKFIQEAAFFSITVGLIIMMTVTHTLMGIYAASFFVSFGFAMMYPSSMSFIMQITPRRLIPVGASFYLGGLNLGMFCSVYLLGFLGNILGGGMHKLYMGAALLMGLCFVAGFFVFRTGKKAAA